MINATLVQLEHICMRFPALAGADSSYIPLF